MEYKTQNQKDHFSNFAQTILNKFVPEKISKKFRKNFFTLSPSYAQSPKNREKSLCPTVLQLRWVISTWWDENMTLFVFSACYEIHWNWFCGRKQTKNAKIRRDGFAFAKGAVIGKSIFQTQRINAVHGRCSSPNVLRDIPSNFTLGIRRRIVL